VFGDSEGKGFFGLTKEQSFSSVSTFWANKKWSKKGRQIRLRRTAAFTGPQANSYLPALFLTIVRVLLAKPEALLLR
jgi:hypothetical protein